ncbi:hypothetical protein [Gymnodinialimonas sp. 57CJ19]|uniref:hypothetical protein n=1 Tax=Gymnodinialimonas sp. 57CJ19 TaxID=3138498 RepID=UPI00313462DD
MTGPKLTSMIVFGTLSLLFGALFSVGLNGVGTAFLVGVIVAGATCAFIWFAKTGRQAFARGFIGLGAVFLIVPVAALSGLGDQLVETSTAVMENGGTFTDEDASMLFLSTLFASAGLLFGMFAGFILVLIGGLMHRNKPAGTAP